MRNDSLVILKSLLAKHPADPGDNASDILVDMQDAVAVGLVWKLSLWKIDTQPCITHCQVIEHLVRDEPRDRFLRLLGAAGNVRGEDGIRRALQWRLEHLPTVRFQRKHIDGCTF